MNVASVNVDKVVSIGEPTQSEVSQTEGQDERSDDAERDGDDEDQETEGNVSHVGVVANNVLVVSVLGALADKVKHVRDELTGAQQKQDKTLQEHCKNQPSDQEGTNARVINRREVVEDRARVRKELL